MVKRELMERVKKFTFLTKPWDMATAFYVKGLNAWCNNPKAKCYWDNSGVSMYVFIPTLTEYQNKL